MNIGYSKLLPWGVLPLLVLVASACSSKQKAAPEQETAIVSDTPTFDVTSSAFQQGAAIPARYTCDGDNVSPPIAWTTVPEDTQSIAIISDDPDAGGTWVHWVLYGIPPGTTRLNESVPSRDTLDDGSSHGANDFRRRSYGGPCPPSGTHRYFFKVYALDAEVDLTPGATKATLLETMEGHVLASGELMGTYQRR